VINDDDQPVYYSARPIDRGVLLTFTLGDGDDHGHVELTMTEAEALDLANLLSIMATT